MTHPRREVYLPNLPIDEQQHQLVLIALKILRNREEEVQPNRVYLFNTYLGKFILKKSEGWDVQWLSREEQITLTQNSGGGWGVGPLPNKPSCLTKV